MKKIINKILLATILLTTFSTLNASGTCDGIGVSMSSFSNRSMDAWQVPIYVCGKKDVLTHCGPFPYDEAQEAFDSCKGWVQSGGHAYDVKNVDVGGYDGGSYYIDKCADSQIAAKAVCTVKYMYWDCIKHGFNTCQNAKPKDGCVPGPYCVEYGWVYDSKNNENQTNCAPGVMYDVVETGASDLDAFDASEFPAGVVLERDPANCFESIEYGLKWSIWKCDIRGSKPIDVNPYNYTFSVNNKTAFCVNPDLPSPTSPGSNEVNIDMTKCESSNSTIDCGFGNILLESYYRRNKLGNKHYTDNVTRLAMFMWGAHTGLGGYNRTGISEFGAGIEDQLMIMPRPNGPEFGKFLNIFKESSKYENVTMYYMLSITKDAGDIYDVLATEEGYNILTLASCDHTDYGGMGVVCNGEYIHAYYLYANTIQGNPDMQKHLNIVNGYEEKTDISEFIDNAPVDASVEVDGDKTIIITYRLSKGVEIDCNSLTGKNAEACELRQVITFRDAFGNPVGKIAGGNTVESYDYCKKNFCYKTVEVEKVGKAVCESEIKTVEIITDVPVLCGANSVKKYEACSNPLDHQTMYTFETDKCEGGIDSTQTITRDVTCETCHDEPTSSSNQKCDDNSKDGIVIKKASDPSLNCILHKATSDIEDKDGTNNTNSKNYYDYTEYFKVNSNICKVYCSDEVVYHFAGKQTVMLGLQLKYDIESKAFGNREELNSNPLTSIVEIKRNCVSTIFYDNISFDYVKDWKKAYDLEGEITNWNTLYKKLSEKSTNDENGRNELLNQLIYDLYNCNFFKESDITGNNGKTEGKVKKPKDSINNYSTVQKIIADETETATAQIQYKGGTEYIGYSGDDNDRVGAKMGKDPILSSTSFSDNEFEVKYCNDDSCFNEKDETATGSEPMYPEDYDAASTSKYATVPLGKDSKNGAAILVTVPANDYAIFTMRTEVDFYNSSRYQTEAYTGFVQPYKEVDADKYAIIEPYLYPVSANAMKNGVCSNKSCDITHKYTVTTFNRKRLNDDQFYYKALTKTYDYFCSYQIDSEHNDDCADGKCKTGYGFAYKNIELTKPFVSDREKEGTNWSTDNAKKVTQQIIESGKNNLRATQDYLEYSYILDSDAIKKIREYNAVNAYKGEGVNSSYTSNTLQNCIKEDNKFFKCRSTFLSSLNNGEYGGTIIKGDGESKYTEELRKNGGVN